MTNDNGRPFDRAALVAGIVFIFFGLMFLLEALGAFDLNPGQLWAILLIGLGVAVLFGERRPSSRA